MSSFNSVIFFFIGRVLCVISNTHTYPLQCMPNSQYLLINKVKSRNTLHIRADEQREREREREREIEREIEIEIEIERERERWYI